VRPVVLPILALLLTGAATPAPASISVSPYVESSERVVDAHGLEGLAVDNPRGLVHVTTSSDGRLHVVATKTCHARRDEDARRFARETTVDAAAHDRRFVVAVHYPRHLEAGVCFWDLFSESGRRRLRMPGVEVRLEIQVPAGLPVEVATTSGDVACEGLSGAQRLTSTSGDVYAQGTSAAIEAQSTSGNVVLNDVSGARVRTTSGDVQASHLAALEAISTSGRIRVLDARKPLALETTSGGIEVRDAPAGIHARTVSGRLEVTGACARVDVETRSGDILAQLREPLQAAQVSSASGDVQLELPGGIGADLRAHSTSGSIDCTIPVTIVEHGRNSLQAKVGRGGAPVRIETSSGDVSITSGGK
jgi:hypothetical protein